MNIYIYTHTNSHTRQVLLDRNLTLVLHRLPDNSREMRTKLVAFNKAPGSPAPKSTRNRLCLRRAGGLS